MTSPIILKSPFGTILNARENPKVIQELLRHANLKVTRIQINACE